MCFSPVTASARCRSGFWLNLQKLVDDVVAVSLSTLLVEAGHGASKRVSVGGVRGGSDAKLCRGVTEERSLLRHHHLFDALVCDALALDVGQVPL